MTGTNPAAMVFTKDSPEPKLPAGTIAVVCYGDYRRQEVWVLSGSNVGNWYPLGGEYGNSVKDRMPKDPHWEDLAERGPVTVLVPMQQDAYQAGWKSGRQHLLYDIEQLSDRDDVAPPMPTPGAEVQG